MSDLKLDVWILADGFYEFKEIEIDEVNLRKLKEALANLDKPKEDKGIVVVPAIKGVVS